MAGCSVEFVPPSPQPPVLQGATPPRGGQFFGPGPTGVQQLPAATQPKPSSATKQIEEAAFTTTINGRNELSLHPVVLCGAMGVGKTALAHRVQSDCNTAVGIVPTYVTYSNLKLRRQKQHVGNHEYLSPTELDNLSQQKALYELYKTQRGIIYSIKRRDVRDIQARGLIPIINIDQEALECLIPDEGEELRYIYIRAPDDEELMARLQRTSIMRNIDNLNFTIPKRHEDVDIFLQQLREKEAQYLFEIENAEIEVTYQRVKTFILTGEKLDEETAKKHVLQLGSEVRRAQPLNGVTIVVEPLGIGGSRFTNKLREENKDTIAIAVSHTTRERRPDEKEGEHYHFVTKKAFQQMWNSDEFLECAKVGGYFYGVTRQELQKVIKKGKKVVIKVNVSGALSIHSVQIGARFILLHQTVDTTIERWIESEKSISQEEINKRVAVLQEELAEARDMPFYFDLVLDTSDSAQCYKRLRDLVITGDGGRAQVTALDGIGREEVVQVVKKDEADIVLCARKGKWLRKGTTMKHDHFPSGKKAGLHENIPGAPNFRQVAVGPDPYGTGKTHAFYGVAQPTLDGWRRVFMRVLNGNKQLRPTTILCVNLREERVMYINQKPFCLKNLQDLYHNTEFPFSTSDRVAKQEVGLKSAIMEEARANSKKFLVHHEEKAEGAELAACGEIYAYYESMDDGESVMTVPQIVGKLKQEEFNLEYLRLPITDEKPPKLEDLDCLTKKLWEVHCKSEADNYSKGCPLIFNCQLGRGRTTTAMLLSLLFLFPPTITLSAPFEEKGDADTPSDTPAMFVRPRSIQLEHSPMESAAFEPERWNCVKRLFKRFKIPEGAQQHFYDTINSCAHIQNLRFCVDEVYEKCKEAPSEGLHKQKLWTKFRNYFRRYYYLAMAAAYYHTEAVGDYKRWREDVWAGEGEPPSKLSSQVTGISFVKWEAMHKLWSHCVSEQNLLKNKLEIMFETDEEYEYEHKGTVKKLFSSEHDGVKEYGFLIESDDLGKLAFAPKALTVEGLCSPTSSMRDEVLTEGMRVSFSLVPECERPTVSSIRKEQFQIDLKPTEKLAMVLSLANVHLKPKFPSADNFPWQAVYFRSTKWEEFACAYYVWKVNPLANFIPFTRAKNPQSLNVQHYLLLQQQQSLVIGQCFEGFANFVTNHPNVTLTKKRVLADVRERLRVLGFSAAFPPLLEVIESGKYSATIAKYFTDNAYVCHLPNGGPSAFALFDTLVGDQDLINAIITVDGEQSNAVQTPATTPALTPALVPSFTNCLPSSISLGSSGVSDNYTAFKE